VSYEKPLWGEGLFLRPQNFQQQDAYHEHRLDYAIKALHPYSWGLQSINVDRDALANRSLRITELSVIFPDGEQLSAPHQDDLPPPLALGDLDIGDSTIISIALPIEKQLGGNVNLEDPQDLDPKYRVHSETTTDLYTHAIESNISFLRKNVRLITLGMPSNHLSCVPILRLRRGANAGYEIDGEFIATSLSIQSSVPLSELLKRILDTLQAKINALYGYHREPSKHIIEFRSGDVASFWLLHTANAAHAALAHLHQHPLFHPERLFQELLRLAGSLMTFSKEFSLADLPVYSHREPEAGFRRLENILRALLETVISTRYFLITLSETHPSTYTGRLDSGKIDDKTTLYLAVNSSMPIAQLEETVPLRFKVGSPDDVEKLVLSAMPGIELSYAPQVPAAIPVKPGTAYFELHAHGHSGKLYETMLQSHSVAVYAPNGIADLKLDLIAVAN
jgi:type VI secretion system protein ImpJ